VASPRVVLVRLSLAQRSLAGVAVSADTDGIIVADSSTAKDVRSSVDVSLSTGRDEKSNGVIVLVAEKVTSAPAALDKV
jgi:hypothetical protein